MLVIHTVKEESVNDSIAGKKKERIWKEKNTQTFQCRKSRENRSWIHKSIHFTNEQEYFHRYRLLYTQKMAGNIVKWWKHKILGGYKQFSGNKKIIIMTTKTQATNQNLWRIGRLNSLFLPFLLDASVPLLSLLRHSYRHLCFNIPSALFLLGALSPKSRERERARKKHVLSDSACMCWQCTWNTILSQNTLTFTE